MTTGELFPRRDVERITSHLHKRELSASDRGGIVLLAGGELDAAAAVLAAVGEALQRDPVARPIVRGALSGGSFVLDEGARGRSALERAADVAAVAKHLVPSPLTGLIVSLIETSAAALRLVRDELPDGSRAALIGPESSVRLLRRAGERAPVVLLIDATDASGSRWFWEMLRDVWGPALATDVRAYLVIACDMRVGAAEAGAGLRAGVADHLEKHCEATSYELLALERADVAAWLGPVRDSLVEQLWDATGGRPVTLLSTWSQWVTAGMIERDTDGVLGFTADADARGALDLHALVVQRIRELAPLNDDAPFDVVDALAIGSLQGQVFDADAVARTLGVDRDLVVDVFDERLVAAGEDRAVLDEFPHCVVATGDGIHSLCRYGFRSDALWLGLRTRGLAPAARRERARRLADALEELYGEDAGRLVPADLAVLRALAGETSAAARWDRIVEGESSPETLRWRAQLVLGSDDSDWSAERCADAALLLADVVFEVTGIGLEETSHYADKAIALADRGNSTRALAAARHAQCSVLCMKRRPGDAVRLGREAISAYEAVPAPADAAAAALTLARALPVSDAVAWYKYAARHGNPVTAAAALIGLADCDKDPAGSRTLLLRAQTLLGTGRSSGLFRAEIWTNLARLEIVTGDPADAIPLLTRAERLSRVLQSEGHLHNVLCTQCAALIAAGEFAGAAGRIREAMDAAANRGLRQVVFGDLESLAICNAYLGRPLDASAAPLLSGSAAAQAVSDIVGRFGRTFEEIAHDRAQGAGPAHASDPTSFQRRIATGLSQSSRMAT